MACWAGMGAACTAGAARGRRAIAAAAATLMPLASAAACRVRGEHGPATAHHGPVVWTGAALSRPLATSDSGAGVSVRTVTPFTAAQRAWSSGPGDPPGAASRREPRLQRQRSPSIAGRATGAPPQLRGQRRSCGRSQVVPATLSIQITVGRWRCPDHVLKISASILHPTHCQGSQICLGPPQLA